MAAGLEIYGDWYLTPGSLGHGTEESAKLTQYFLGHRRGGLPIFLSVVDRDHGRSIASPIQDDEAFEPLNPLGHFVDQIILNPEVRIFAIA